MVNATHVSYDASDRSYYAIIKKEVHNLAIQAGFSEIKVAELDIVLAELTSNLHKYARNGELLVGHIVTDTAEYIELLSMDSGPGISDISRTLTDGYSSSNSMGHGLGSIRRLSDQFDIYSRKGWGTIILSRIFKNSSSEKIVPRLRAFPIVISKPQQLKCGDGYYVKNSTRFLKLVFADGLGHGPDANLAMNSAVKAFRQCTENSPVQILRFMHREVRKTRGLVATVVVVDRELKKIYVAGVGNISSRFSGPSGIKNHLCYNGIIGHNIPTTMNDQELDLGDFNQVTCCSDGIRSGWNINSFMGIGKNDASIQAAAIFKEYRRMTDDMSVLIVKF